MAVITFSEDHPFNDHSIKFSAGVAGTYFIYLREIQIPYPFQPSRLIYIGISETKENSIAKRLRGHLTGQSGNDGIKNYAARYSVAFTFYSLRLLEKIGTSNLFEIETFFLDDFMRRYGSFPICNNQSGHSIETAKPLWETVQVDWTHFE